MIGPAILLIAQAATTGTASPMVAVQPLPTIISWSDETRASGQALSECLFRNAKRMAASDAEADLKLRRFRGTCRRDRAAAIRARESDYLRHGLHRDFARQRSIEAIDERYDLIAERTFLKAPPQSIDIIPVTRLHAKN